MVKASTVLVGVQADKRWQMADWRVRPLSEEALLYARMDTHYLLYMYDLIKVHSGLSRACKNYLSHWPETCRATRACDLAENKQRLLCCRWSWPVCPECLTISTQTCQSTAPHP